jgi:hypothetical protein
MVDPEATSRLRKGPSHVDRPLEKARERAGISSAKDANARVALAEHCCATEAGAFDPDMAVALALYTLPVIIDPSHTCSLTKTARHTRNEVGSKIERHTITTHTQAHQPCD